MGATDMRHGLCGEGERDGRVFKAGAISDMAAIIPAAPIAVNFKNDSC